MSRDYDPEKRRSETLSFLSFVGRKCCSWKSVFAGKNCVVQFYCARKTVKGGEMQIVSNRSIKLES